MLLRPEAQFDLALRTRGAGAPLAEVFAFLSGLYFRGKVAYAERFARAGAGTRGAYCISADRGLLPLDQVLTDRDLAAFNAVAIDARNPVYTLPLEATALQLSASLTAASEIVLLGSVATAKYIRVLLPIFGERLRYPKAFAGRGDMSRGSLMLRCVREERELEYATIVGAC